jgi:hypothetical protein
MISHYKNNRAPCCKKEPDKITDFGRIYCALEVVLVEGATRGTIGVGAKSRAGGQSAQGCGAGPPLK